MNPLLLKAALGQQLLRRPLHDDSAKSAPNYWLSARPVKKVGMGALVRQAWWHSNALPERCQNVSRNLPSDKRVNVDRWLSVRVVQFGGSAFSHAGVSA